MGISTEALYQYVPATKLKGLDEWVPESLHYSFMSRSMYDLFVHYDFKTYLELIRSLTSHLQKNYSTLCVNNEQKSMSMSIKYIQKTQGARFDELTPSI